MRTIKNKSYSSATSTGSRPKPVHYINFVDADTGAKVGYMTLDSQPDKGINNDALIEVCQESAEFVDSYFSSPGLKATYSQLGVSTKPTQSANDLRNKFLKSK